MAVITRRKFVRGSAVAATAVMLAIGSDALVIEPNRPQLNRINVPLARLPQAFDGFTIAQLSDFHYDEHFSAIPIRKSVEMLNALNPDLVALTGDFVTVPLFSNRLRDAHLAAALAPAAVVKSAPKAAVKKPAVAKKVALKSVPTKKTVVPAKKVTPAPARRTPTVKRAA